MEIFAEPQGDSFFLFFFFLHALPLRRIFQVEVSGNDQTTRRKGPAPPTAVDDTYCLLLEVDAMDTAVCTLYFSRAIVERIEVDERYRIPDIPKEFARVQQILYSII